MAKAKNDEFPGPLEIPKKLAKGPKTLPKIGQGTPKSAKGVANTVPNDVWGSHFGEQIYKKSPTSTINPQEIYINSKEIKK